MDITIVYKIAGVGIIVAILNVVLNQAGRQEQAHLLSLAGVVVVLFWLLHMISDLFDDVESVFKLWQ